MQGSMGCNGQSISTSTYPEATYDCLSHPQWCSPTTQRNDEQSENSLVLKFQSLGKYIAHITSHREECYQSKNHAFLSQFWCVWYPFYWFFRQNSTKSQFVLIKWHWKVIQRGIEKKAILFLIDKLSNIVYPKYNKFILLSIWRFISLW